MSNLSPQTHEIPVAQVIFDFLSDYGFINFNASNLSFTPGLTSKSVVVVGAGISGITAARHLRSFGYSVIVLEAKEKIGGRIRTEQLKLATNAGVEDAYIEHGASILTGTIGNPLCNVLNQLSTKLHVLNSSCPLFTNSGDLLPQSLDQSAEHKWNKFLEISESLRKDYSGFHDISLLQAFNIIREDQLKISEKEDPVLNWHISNLEYGCASSLSNVSLLNWDQDDPYDYDGNHALLPQGGFGKIVQHLSSDVDIQLNCPVNEIQWCFDGSSKAQVRCLNGRTFKADYVLCTVSLGVLKQNLIQFSPELPKMKLEAISRLGFGVINKLILVFETAFWDSFLTSDTFGYVDTSNNSSSNAGRFYIFWNLFKSSNHPILVALCSGDAAVNSESESLEELKSDALSILKTIFQSNFRYPIHYSFTRWMHEPYILGSYSYISVGSSGKDYDLLGKSVGNLYFAGEATNRYHPATVGGAFESGLRESGNIIRHEKAKINIIELFPSYILELMKTDNPRSSHESKQLSFSKRNTSSINIRRGFRASNFSSELKGKEEFQSSISLLLQGKLDVINPKLQSRQASLHSPLYFVRDLDEIKNSQSENDLSEEDSCESYQRAFKRRRTKEDDFQFKNMRDLKQKAIEVISTFVKEIVKSNGKSLYKDSEKYKEFMKKTTRAIITRWKEKGRPSIDTFIEGNNRKKKLTELVKKYIERAS